MYMHMVHISRALEVEVSECLCARLDQELISYRYSSSSCCSFCRWGDLFKKAYAPSFQMGSE